MRYIVDCAENLGWIVRVEGSLFIFADLAHEEYNFRIWAETVGEFIHKVQLLAYNYRKENDGFYEKLNVLCEKIICAANNYSNL